MAQVFSSNYDRFPEVSTEVQKPWWSPAKAVGAAIIGVPFLLGVIDLRDRVFDSDGPHIIAAGERHRMEVPDAVMEATAKLDEKLLPKLGYETFIEIAIKNDGPLTAENVRIQTGTDG